MLGTLRQRGSGLLTLLRDRILNVLRKGAKGLGLENGSYRNLYAEFCSDPCHHASRCQRMPAQSKEVVVQTYCTRAKDLGPYAGDRPDQLVSSLQIIRFLTGHNLGQGGGG